jgi:hypothetical protein
MVSRRSKQKQGSSRNQPGKSREKDPRRSKRSYDQRSKTDLRVKRSRGIIPKIIYYRIERKTKTQHTKTQMFYYRIES